MYVRSNASIFNQILAEQRKKARPLPQAKLDVLGDLKTTVKSRIDGLDLEVSDDSFIGPFMESAFRGDISHREVVVCFSDIRGFSDYCHTLQERGLDEKIEHFLNEYFPLYLKALLWEVRSLQRRDQRPGPIKQFVHQQAEEPELSEITRLIVPSSFKNLGDGMMIVWELGDASSATVQGLTTRSIFSYVSRIIALFDYTFHDYRSQAATDAFSHEVDNLRLGVGLTKGHVLRIDFPGRSLPDYAGSIINMASRLVDHARPEGIVAHLDFSASLFEAFRKKGFGRTLAIKGIRGMNRDPVQVWTTDTVKIPRDRIC